MAGLYIVGAWVAIQVAEVSFEAWGVPDSALRFLFISAIACFPIALVFSWFYDVTVAGIVRTETLSDNDAIDLRLKLKDYLLLMALFAIGALIVLGSVTQVKEETSLSISANKDAEIPEYSIAILPFDNFDDNTETGYFSDGITEDILNRLGELKLLHVLASNTSFAFRNSQSNPGELMQELGVRYLLQGSIRREADSVRVTARLLDQRGFQLWSGQFDRRLIGIFAIQSEIASTVASEVIHEIVPLAALPAGRTTENTEAYDLYLLGKAILDRRTTGWRERAKQALEKAIELDPGFAPPYAALAKTIAVNTKAGPQWGEAAELVERALELDGELAEGYAAKALILVASGEPNPATISARRAIELNPSMGFAYNILAIALERMGREEEGREVRLRGLALDWANPPLAANAADVEARFGNYERAEQILRRLLYLPEPPRSVYGSLLNLLDSRGRFVDALATAKQLARVFAARGEYCCNDYLSWTYGNLGMKEEADYWMGLSLENDQLSVSSLGLARNLLVTRGPKSDLGNLLRDFVNEPGIENGQEGWNMAQFGLVNIYVGNHETGARQLDLGVRQYHAQVTGTELGPVIDIAALTADESEVIMVMHNLAFSYKQRGRQDRADTILQALSDTFDMQGNPLHYALRGNPKAALRTMRAMQENGAAQYFGPGKYFEISNNPIWAETITQPGFPALLADMKVELDRQRAEVEAIESESDFRGEIQRLMEK
jgi:TolB-like protein/Flp pilus assembly protein TadD